MYQTACNERDLALIPGWGRSPGEENGNPLQYSCLGNPIDRADWWATFYGVIRVEHEQLGRLNQHHRHHPSDEFTIL